MTDTKQRAPLSLAKQTLLALESLEAKLEASERARTEPIAVIGIGCRFPGGITGPESFWELLCQGKDAITKMPLGRRGSWGLPGDYTNAKTQEILGGFLADVDGFDANFFGISPREAATMDPQQRLVLEVAWEALENAGHPPDRLAGSQTGVFIGVTTHDYLQMQVQRDLQQVDSYFGTGTSPSLHSGRLSYFLGLHGPSLTVDTACSSSLVTVHLACQSLRARECDLALAGGVNLLLSPELTVYFSKISALAADGRCKAFDASADGFVRSEGCGLIVLKRLSDAVAVGDDILALVRGSAVNHDGRSNGLTAPNAAAQEAVIRQALSSARVAASAIEYVEAHGSGTPLGDPIELRAIAAALHEGREPSPKVWVGSVKTNFGHVEAAAGIAGLIKIVLALRNGKIPPHLHFNVPTPHLSWDQMPVAIPTACVDWPARKEPRFAGVSSFGLSGTNAHAILSDAPLPEQKPKSLERPPEEHLLPVSARSQQALQDLAENYRDFLSMHPELPVHEICAAAALDRAHHNHRLVVLGQSSDEMREGLDSFLQKRVSAFVSSGQQASGYRRKIVFVFPGHGSQWLGMGKSLLEAEPVFRRGIEECDRAIRAGAGWSVLEELQLATNAAGLERVDVVQPLLFAFEFALAKLWRFYGVSPDTVVGHSMGEVAAACVAGALSLDEAARIICLRSRLLRQQSGKGGGMAVVELSVEAAERAIAGYADKLCVAVSNGPRTTVISGDKVALAEVIAALEKRCVFCRQVKFGGAAHTPETETLLPAMLSELSSLRPNVACVPFYSTVNGDYVQGTECDARYWAANLRNPVLFWDAVRGLSESGHDVFLEISPHPILVSSIQDGVRSLGKDALVLASLKRDGSERGCLLDAAGKLYTAGVEIDWEGVYRRPSRRVGLPIYSWQRERFWLEEPKKNDVARLGRPDTPLLGRRLQSAIHANTHFWEIDLATGTFPYLRDHSLFGEIVFPAAGYVEMALEAATDLWGTGNYALADFSFQRLLVLPEKGARTVQFALVEDVPGGASLTVSSRDAGESDWTVHATARVARSDHGHPSVPAFPATLAPGEAHIRTAEDHYRRSEARGLSYGPAFRGLEFLTCSTEEALATVRAPQSGTAANPSYNLHPALLDAAFQVMASPLALEACDRSSGLYVPTALESLRLFATTQQIRSADSAIKVYAKLLNWDAHSVSADLVLADEQGQVIVHAKGLQARRISDPRKPVLSEQDRIGAFRIDWKASDLPAEAQAQPGVWILLGNGSSLQETLTRLLRQSGSDAIVLATEMFSPAAIPTETVGPLRGVVYLAEKGERPRNGEPALNARQLQESVESQCLSIAKVVRSLSMDSWPAATPLFLVTRGSQPVTNVDRVSPTQASLWGLGRSVALEQSALGCTLIDLDTVAGPHDAEHIAKELHGGNGEDQVAWRKGRRFVARLAQSEMLDTPAEPAAPRAIAAGSRAYRLGSRSAGVLDNLQLREIERKDPGPEEVEIAVEAAGLNFHDVMRAMGAMPGVRPEQSIRLGYECAGRVVRVGPGVQSLRVGDRVVAVSPESIASHVVVPEILASRFADHLTMAQAAAIPVAFITASYALEHLARIQKGESVLIHSATGGVGLAAIQIARRIGAEIFATAGSEEKRNYLRDLGIRHVLDSRSLTFGTHIRQITGGRGVDIVLNSLAGEAVQQGIAALAPGGRFLEIGKKDIYENRQIGLLPFRNNLSYCAIDLVTMAETQPQVIGKFLQEVLDKFRDESLHPAPIAVFPISHAVEAFHQMAQARHIGKLVLIMDASAMIYPLQASGFSLAKGTYLITGGLGDLGLLVAQWMVDRGVRHLVLLGRSDASPSANIAIDAMLRRGAEVVVERADVSDEAQLARVLRTIDDTMPTLRGVVHAAGSISDGTILKLDAAQFRSVMLPKVQGTWNLHLASQGRPIDFFVMFSSAASVLGSTGQANYAAANAFMDAVAHLRRAQGLPAQAINWGAWSETGMAARAGLGGKLERDGIASMRPQHALAALERAMEQSEPQLAIMRIDVGQWCATHSSATGRARRLFTDLVAWNNREAEKAAPDDFVAKLRTASSATRSSLLEAKLCELVGHVLRLPVARIDRAETLGSFGFDSLTALELRNRLQSLFGVRLSATMVWNYPTIPALAAHISDVLGLSLASEEGGPPVAPQDNGVEHSLNELTSGELASLLDTELNDLGFAADAKPYD